MSPRLICFFKSVIIFSAFIVTCAKASAQYEFLATLDYSNLTVNRIGNIPGVTWINLVNSTYDQNHQRFFFVGNANQTPPWYLYTINAVNGATISHPVCSSGLEGLQYDNGVDTLYAINLVNGTGSFVWVDPATGTVHNKSTLINYPAYTWSAYDTKDHWYITNNNDLGMTVIDVFTGAVVYNSYSQLYMDAMIYDNLNGRLYGIDYMNMQFDSISLSTGEEYTISNLPTTNVAGVGTYTIDEAAGKFIFVGSGPAVGQCFSDYLYVLDVNTGAVLSNTLYKYLQNPTVLIDENLIEYSFDNKRGILYALNWHPPGSPITSINILSTPNPACPGTPVQFVAIPDGGISNPVYQWQVNGKNVGTNSETYIYETPVSGDSVRCIMSFLGVCTGPAMDTSFSIVIQSASKTQNPASIQITDSSDTVCQNGQATFYAHTLNSGVLAIFQWMVDGVAAGNSDSVFVTSSLVNGDMVQCIITVNSVCTISVPDSSNVITVNVQAVFPSVTISGSKTVVCSGDSVVFTASPMNAGENPVFQWEINGITADETGGNIFVSTSLNNNDSVTCIMKGSIACSEPAVSNAIVTMVNPLPTLIVGDDTAITPNQTLRLQPVVGAGVISYLWTPGIYLDNPSIADPVFTPGVTTSYQLLITGDDGCSSSGNITIVVYRSLKMPNSFTPNGDGIDDVFRIPPKFALNIESFSVFNRWGQRIFYTSNSGIGWDGTLNGLMQPEDTYVWMIQYKDPLTNKFETASGTVILIR
jgi:gliding motility-associated-like protein